ncbi:hypothetical protein SODALDRAFT_347552 [Sodiomyces alkalinus F11]|uniref:Uncharacterized protein n=1 Tax=Sodiomyces alkalinus (strain CBS 110278 / VKM F-3762 / F11) TaxID=1314773 RepID=A0A3N2Q777_SODAK|nr:hypothetical protein SODALDRAFT_347552 [Sodiomyces alkalinus F11]ROT42624.1 hypothetical protein SODALDRAFT_347552 [Sodiomyces alkalinus F11]
MEKKSRSSVFLNNSTAMPFQERSSSPNLRPRRCSDESDLQAAAASLGCYPAAPVNGIHPPFRLSPGGPIVPIADMQELPDWLHWTHDESLEFVRNFFGPREQTTVIGPRRATTPRSKAGYRKHRKTKKTAKLEREENSGHDDDDNSDSDWCRLDLRDVASSVQSELEPGSNASSPALSPGKHTNEREERECVIQKLEEHIKTLKRVHESGTMSPMAKKAMWKTYVGQVNALVAETKMPVPE